MPKRVMQTLTMVIGLAALAFAATPQMINYQGRLTDNLGGTVADGSYSVVFTIYDADAAGTSVWTETQNVNTVDGLFAVLLGSVNPLLDTVFNGTTRYLGIAVAGDPEISPRTAMVSVPYAMRVNTVDGASGGNISSKVSIGPNVINSGLNAFAAGHDNTASGDNSTVSGGSKNNSSGTGTTVGGGRTNNGFGMFATISGGSNNYASGILATVGGGNSDSAYGDYATICGGQQNLAISSYTTIGGGQFNTVGGMYSTVPGGLKNSANGEHSFAAGRQAKAVHAGTFVWADTTNTNFSSSTANQFNVRASGGTRIYSNSALTAGVTLAAGASSWSAVSDSNLKRNIREVDYQNVLEKLATLPISQWSYESQDESIEHIGPMAQDFYRLFSLGEDDKHINTLDLDGVALAAIKALHKENQELKERLHKLEDIVKRMAD